MSEETEESMLTDEHEKTFASVWVKVEHNSSSEEEPTSVLRDYTSPYRRVGYDQLVALWEILDKHKTLATGFNKTTEAREATKRMWETIADHLNVCDGVVKDWKGWCKYWIDYKSKIKNRVAAEKAFHGTLPDNTFTDIELKFVKLIEESPKPVPKKYENDNAVKILQPAKEKIPFINLGFTEKPKVPLKICRQAGTCISPIPFTRRRKSSSDKTISRNKIYRQKLELAERKVVALENIANYLKNINDLLIERPKKKCNKPKKIYECDECYYTTKYKHCLETHVYSHTDTKQFSCTECEYTAKYSNSLQRHMVIKHQANLENNDRTYKCESCDYTSPYKWNLNSHKRKHKLEKQFKCSLCSFETAYRHNYIKHSKTHIEPIVFQCDKCPFTTKFEGHITRHLAIIHKEIMDTAHKCDFCDFATKVKWRLNVHKQRSKLKMPLKCDFHQCGFEANYSCELRKHKTEHFNERIVQAQQETKQIEEENNVVTRHEPQSSQDFLYNSDDNNEFIEPKAKTEKKVHGNTKKGRLSYNLDPNCMYWFDIQIMESDDKERPFQCHMCSYTSKFKAAVQRHFQRRHTGSHNRPYKCLNCDFSTKTKDQISLHNKRSQTEVLQVCDACEFTTYYKCQLVMHQKAHNGFKCDECNYSSRHSHELRKHYWSVHLGQGIKCRFCNYKSSRKQSLICHESTHTGYKPFKCELCPYEAVRKFLLRNHKERCHRNEKQDVKVVSEDKIESLKIPISELNVQSEINSLNGMDQR